MAHSLTRITVATDLSARSDRALERAFQLGNALGLPVEALMILDEDMPETLRAPLHEKAAAQLDALCTRWSGGCPFTVNVQAGDPSAGLVQAAETPGTLVVMGPHRPRAFLDLLRETTMQRVVRQTAAPVLVVTEPVTGPYRAMLSMIDFNEPADNAMHLGAALAAGARIQPCHAVHVPYSGSIETTGAVQLDLQQSLLEDAEREGVKWAAAQTTLAGRLEPMQVTSTPPNGIVRAATEDRSFDLLTAGAHGPVGASRALLGSVATDLMRAPPCDVLISR